jgi:hypothetical protein
MYVRPSAKFHVCRWLFKCWVDFESRFHRDVLLQPRQSYAGTWIGYVLSVVVNSRRKRGRQSPNFNQWLSIQSTKSNAETRKRTTMGCITKRSARFLEVQSSSLPTGAGISIEHDEAESHPCKDVKKTTRGTNKQVVSGNTLTFITGLVQVLYIHMVLYSQSVPVQVQQVQEVSGTVHVNVAYVKINKLKYISGDIHHTSTF